MIIYSFIGLPASGKDTQAEILAKKIGAKVYGVGDLIREAIETSSDDPFVSQIERRYDKGQPQPDEVAIKLVDKKISNISNQTLIFSNFPFSIRQAEYIDRKIEEIGANLVVFYIQVDPSTSIERATTRRVCPDCRQIYPSDYAEKRCAKCGSELQSRTDDNKEVVKKRIDQYKPHIEAILDYYQNLGTLFTINGEESIDRVSQSINQKINSI